MSKRLIVLLFAFVALLTPQIANASSIYDNSYQTTNRLTIKKSGCDEQDISLKYVDMIYNSSKWSGSNNTEIENAIQAVKDSYASDNGNYAISNHYVNADRTDAIFIFTQNSSQLTWNANGVWLDGYSNANTTTLRIQKTGCNDTDYAVTIIGGRDLSISMTDSSVKNFIVFTNNPNYPTDYEGQLIQESMPILNDMTFTYSITPVKDEGGQVQMIYTGVKNDMTSHCGVRFNILNDDLSVLDSKVLGQTEVYNYTGLTSGNYWLKVTQNACSPFITDTKLKEVPIHVTYEGRFLAGIADGSTSEGNLAQLPAWFYDANPLFESFGLLRAINAPINAIKGLLVQTCSPFTLPILDKNINIPCLKSTFYAPYLGNVLTIYQVVMTGGFGYIVTLNVMTTVKNALNPDDDKIEVLNL